MSDEGWFCPGNANKFHYFREGRSLCRRYGLLPRQEEHLKPETVPHPDDCVACRRRLEKK